MGIETVPAVVFVTAHERHALRAFDVEAVDYLLKPFDDERFATTLRRVKSALVRRTMTDLERGLDPDRFFRVHRSAIVRLSRVRDVRAVGEGEHSVVLHDGTVIRLAQGKVRELERRLATPDTPGPGR